MALITFNFKDFLGDDLENNQCRITAPQPISSNGVLLVNSPIYLADGDVVDLPSGIYTARVSGSNTSIKGWFEVGTVAANFSSLFNITINPQDIPQSLPISAINGLQAELDEKLDITDPRVSRIPTPPQLVKLDSVQSGATQNSTDTFLLSRENHTGTQPISSINGLQFQLDGKADDSEITSINYQISTLSANQITSVERTKLSGIQTGATQNSTDAFLLNRENHTGTQAHTTITGLGSAATQNSSAFQSSNARLTSISNEPNPTNPIIPQINPDGSVTFIPVPSGGSSGVSSFNGRAGSVTPLVGDYSSFYVQPNTSPSFNSLSMLGDVSIGCFGSTTTSPRTLGMSGLNTGNAARFQFGDAVNCIQNSFGGRIQLLGWHGIELYGAHGGTLPSFQNGSGASDYNLSIFGASTTSRLLRLQSTSGATADIIRAFRGSQEVFRVGNLGSVSLWSGTNEVVLSPYSQSATEHGLSMPLLRVTNGRIDFNPLDNKAEFRVTGSNTELGIFNTTTNRFYLRVNSDGDQFTTRHLWANGNIVAGNTNTGNHRLFVDGNGLINGTLETQGILTFPNRAFNTVGSVVPVSPAIGHRWLEIQGNQEVARWTWNGTDWITSIGLFSVPSDVLINSTRTLVWGLAWNTIGTGFIIRSVSELYRANTANHDATNRFTIGHRAMTMTGSNDPVGVDYLTTTVTTTANTPNIQTVNMRVPWLNFNRIQTVLTRSGTTASLNARFSVDAVIYR